MLSSVDDINFETFSRHVPSILVTQVLKDLAQQYVKSETEGDTAGSNTNKDIDKNLCRPTIEHFYGALLFVDISGFTILSQRLSIEHLRYHINSYFTKILQIVSAYGGDIVKFAGDALFIIWPVQILDNGK